MVAGGAGLLVLVAGLLVLGELLGLQPPEEVVEGLLDLMAGVTAGEQGIG
jgi:hypothetical protein